MRPNTLAVIGLGAIGGSVAWQARLAGIPRVVGYALDRCDSVRALRSGAVHDIADSPARAMAGAELVLLATPTAAIVELLGSLSGWLAPGALVTDVASIKAPIVTCAVRAGLATRFAGSHPFTGTHVAGWEGARPDRFTGAVVYVSSTGTAGDRAAREIMDFWQGVLGAQPVLVEAAAHDAQLAWTSHLPQVVASALARTVGGSAALRGATWGAGIRDTTRLASSAAEIWVDTLLLNRERILEALAGFSQETADLGRLVSAGDRDGLYRWLEEAAQIRAEVERRTGAD